MKSLILAAAILTTTHAFAGPQPIRENVTLKSSRFSGMIYEALVKKLPVETINRVGAAQEIVKIQGLLECHKNTALVSGGKRNITHRCILTKGRWNELGRDTYGSGDSEKETLALFAALTNTVEEKDEAFVSKTIEFNTPDPQGGTERNLLSCIKPTKLGAKLGLRATCQLIDAM